MSEQTSTINEEQPHQEVAQINPEDVYLIGGNDLEMQRIRQALRKAHVEFVDRDPTWEEAKIETYEDDVKDILAEGKTPVAIELRGADRIEGVHDVDHHGAKTERPASITQVLERIGRKASLVNRLVAANDAGYIPGMLKQVEQELDELKAKGYNDEQLRRATDKMMLLVEGIRLRDREAQGVTPEDEAEAEEAIKQAERLPNGLIVVRVNSTRYSQVADRLYSLWPDGKQNLIVVCSSNQDVKEVWFMGDGEIVQKTRDHFSEIREQKIADGSRDENEYHTVNGGAGYGKKGENAQCLVVAKNSEEVVGYISELESQESAK